MAESISWIDNAGVSTALDGTGNYLAVVGRNGMWMPPVSFIEQDIPLQPGTVLRLVKVLPRPVLIPILIQGASNTESSFYTSLRFLENAMNPLRGDGHLKFTAADGTIRKLTCRLQSGFEGDESATARGPANAVVPFQFYANDPFWYDNASTTVSKTNLTLPSFTITNTGDAEMWPVWTIHGPGSSLVVTDTTTGLLFSTGDVLGGSDVLVIDTTPGVKTMTLNGVNDFTNLVNSSTLFSLTTGANAITVALAGTSSATTLSVVYKQRWNGV